MLNKKIIALAVWGSLCCVGLVQAAPSDSFYEDRITKEVTQEGMSLQKLGLRIEVHQSDKGAVILNLVEVTTGRILQSRFIETVSSDANAAVAELSIVASALILPHGGPRSKPVANTGSWATAITAEAVRSRHHPESVHVIVLSSAEEPGERAAKALVAAYRANDVAVVTGPSTSMYSDVAATLRQFGDSTAENYALLGIKNSTAGTMAVVTVVKKDGVVLTALSFTSGKVTKPLHTEGVTLPSDTLGRVGKDRNKRSEGLKAYAAKRVSVTGITIGSAYGEVHASAAYQGNSSTPLLGKEYYWAVGRKDYADEYSANETKKRVGNWIRWSGLAVSTVAVIWAFASRPDFDVDEPSTAEESSGLGGRLYVAIAATGVRTAGYLYGLIYHRPDPVDDKQRISLAKVHNDKLRKMYGLTEEDTLSIDGRQQSSDYNLQLSPYVVPTSSGRSGGLQMRLEF